MFESLGIDLVSLIWQIVAFGVLIWLLNRLLFRPIRETLDERARRIRVSMEEAERIKHQAIQADEKYEERIEEAQRRAQGILEQARDEAREERDRILEQAQEEIQQRRKDARTQIEMERRDMAREARRQVAGLAVLTASRIIDETLDQEKQRRLAEQYVDRLDEPLQELGQVLADLPREQVGVVQVRSATTLSEETQQEIRHQVARSLGEDIPITFDTDPGLIGGFVLQVGDQVVDLSVSRKLNILFQELVTA